MPEEIQGELLEDVSLAAEPAIEEERAPDRDPAPVPEPSEVEVPKALAAGDPPGDEALPGEAIGVDPGALGGPAALRLVQPGGDPPGRGGDGRHPGLPGVGRELLRPLSPRAPGRSSGAGLHQHLLLAARRRRAARGVPGGGAGPSDDVFVRGFECLGACDIAPMASIDERYYGPLEDGRRGRGDRAAARQARRCCPRSAWRTAGSREARPHPPTSGSRGHPIKTTRARERSRGSADAAAAQETRDPLPQHRRAGARLDPDLPAARRLRGDPQGLQGDEPGGGAEGARGLGPPRPRRRRLLDGQEGLVPAPRRHGQVPLLQRRRVRAGRLQGPRADAEEPSPADRGDRRSPPAPPARTAASSTSAASTTSRATSSTGRSRRPTRPASSARTSSGPASRWSWSSTAAPAPTSAARRPPCSTRSRASGQTRG